jgi:hypothetical protein
LLPYLIAVGHDALLQPVLYNRLSRNFLPARC